MTIVRYALSCLVLFGLSSPAAAQTTTYTWTGGGGDGNWSTLDNWGGSRPVSSLTDTLISLAGTTNTATTIDTFYGSTLQIRGLTFENAAGPFTVAGGGPVLEVGVGGIVANGGSVTQVISAPVRLGANQTWTAVGPSTLRVSGQVDLNGFTLTTGTTGLGLLELTGPVVGTGRLDPHRIILSGANTYSGGTLIDNGGWVQTATAAGLGTGLVELKGNSTITVTAAGDATLGSGLAVTNVGANDINRLQINHVQAVVRLPAGGLSGTGTLSREGTGTLILTGANPFSGTLYTGTGGRMELIDSGGGASMNASSYNIYFTTFRVGPGATLGNHPVIADLGGRVEFEQSQTLTGLGVGLATSPINNNTAVIAPNVTLTVSGYVVGCFGTLDANITGFLSSGFTKDSTGTLVMSGNSDFVGTTRVYKGVLSINTIANAGSPSAIGAHNEIELGPNATLRYTGASASTNRKLNVSSFTGQPGTVEVTNAATVLTWNAPVNFGSGRAFVKAGPGTLVLTATSETSLGDATVAGGTLTVTGTGGLKTSAIVQSGATLAGKLTAPGANLNVSGGVTIQTGATLRAGTGGSADKFGVGSAVFQPGTTFVVTADGGTTPSASRLTTEGGGAADVNFQATAANPITVRIEKGAGAEFTPFVPVTVEIVHANFLTGGIDGNVLLRGGTFTYVASEWNIQTVGFEIVPGSASLITDTNKTTLSVQFTPVPEPLSVLGVATAGGLALTLGRLVRRRITSQPA
jgi:autotransporter-associated beta strand protein